MELEEVEPIGVMVDDVDNDDAVIVEPVTVDKVVSNVDIVVVDLLLSSSLAPGIRRTHKIISKVNKSIKITTKIIMIFLVLLSFT